MKPVYLTFLLAALSSAVASASSNNGEVLMVPHGEPHPGLKRGPRSEILAVGRNPRIVSGQYAAEKQIPFQVTLITGFNNSYALGGGALISVSYVLTAAHCVSGCKSAEVRLGSTNKEKPLAVKWGLEYVNHPVGDISLLKIQSVEFNAYISAASLPPLKGPNSLYINEKATASGWGATDDKKTLGVQLKFVTMRIMAPDECAKTYGSIGTDPAILCTDTKNVGGTCSGDSGGPLVLLNTRLLVGITTFVNSAGCTAGYPDGFARVTYYLQFIKDVCGISA